MSTSNKEQTDRQTTHTDTEHTNIGPLTLWVGICTYIYIYIMHNVAAKQILVLSHVNKFHGSSGPPKTFKVYAV